MTNRRTTKPLSRRERARLIKLVDRGLTYREIARRIGRHYNTVYNHVTRVHGGHPGKPRVLTDQQVDRLYALADAGFTKAEVARHVGCHENTVYRRLRNRSEAAARSSNSGGQ